MSVPSPALQLAMKARRVAITKLQHYHANPRRGDVSAIAASLASLGQYKPIVVNAGTLTGRPDEVLAGNHTLDAAVSLGWSKLEAVFVDVDEATARRIVLADNRTADLGGYDDEVLSQLLAATGDLEGTGYSDRDLAAIMRRVSPPVQLTDPDEVPPVPVDAVSVLGDVWHLGESRLFVGDAGDVAGVLEAAGPLAPADAVWTDPPYGVDYVGGNHALSLKERKARGGLEVHNDAAARAIEVWTSAVPTMLQLVRPGAPVYVAHPDQGRELFTGPLIAAGCRLRQTLIWVKDSLVMSRSDYHYRTEPVLEASLPDPEGDYVPVAYGFTPGGEGRLGRGGPHWHGDNKSSNVFEVPRPKRSAEHPTMKPTDLIRPMLHNSVQAGGVVVDLFAGSGSTLIAAHAEGMRAFLVEFSPLYADVICRRWQEHTGQVPVRNGKPVSFVGGA